MTDRTVSVSLVAQVNGYLNGMQKAQLATDKTATSAQKLAAKGQAFTQFGRTIFAMGAVAAAGFAIAVKKFADFDAKMAVVQSLSHGTAKEMKGLTTAALHMGQSLGVSANEVADAETELVKAGISVKDILGGALIGALTLAADGQMNVADATQIVTEAMTQFALKGKDVPHIADLLAAGADKALGSVGDLGAALEQGGLVAHQFGLTIDDTTGTLAAFAQAGIVGERGGTDLRQMLLKLAAPSAEADALLKKYNITLYDASGKFVGVTKLAGELKDHLGTLSDAQRNSALATIFGSRAIQGANVLYQDGAKGIQKWIDEVNDQGFAMKQAEGKMNSLEGDVKKLGAAFDTSLIEAGSGANVILRGLTEGLTGFVNGIGDLPKPVLDAGLAITGAVGAIGLLGGGALMAVPKILATKVAMDQLDISGKSMARGFGRGGVVVAAVAATTIGIVALDKAINTVRVDTDNMQASLIGATSGAQILAAATRDIKPGALSATMDGATTSFVDFQKMLTRTALVWKQNQGMFLGGLNGPDPISGDFLKSLHTLGDQLSKLSTTNMPAAQKAFKLLGDQTDGSRKQMWELLSDMPSLRDAFKNQATQMGINVNTSKAAVNQQRILDFAMGKSTSSTKDNASSTETAASAYTTAADKAKTLTDAISSLTDQINTANGVGQDAVSTNASYQQSLSDADATIQKAKDHVEGYSLGLNANTVSGSANLSMLAGLASKNEAAANAQLKVDQNTMSATDATNKYQATLKAGHDAVVKRAEELGATAAQAQKIANNIAGIPSKKQIQVLMDTSYATQSLNKYIAYVESRRPRLYIQGQVLRPGAMPAKFAQGGRLPGAPSTKDNMLVHAASGEYITNSKATARNLHVLNYINSGGTVNGYAGGGMVAPMRYVPAPRQYAMTAAPAPTGPSQRPIYMDGTLFGVLRQMANGEAQIVVDTSLQTVRRQTSNGMRL